MATAVGSATMKCGSFVAICTGYNRWKFVCDWLPEFEQEVECTQAKAGDLVIRLQAEYRDQAPQLVVVK